MLTVDMLWRRETRKEGTGQRYPAGEGDNSVRISSTHDTPWVETVLFTDFNLCGKILNPAAADLARAAIASVKDAEEGKDGITYLMDNLAAGIEAPLTKSYESEILKQTKADSLKSALNFARNL